MTGKQIMKALKNSGQFSEEELSFVKVSKSEVEVTVPDPEREGKAEEELTEALVDRIFEVLGPKSHGFQCGWGGWVIEVSKFAPREMGEYCDVSSAYHY